MHEDQLDVDVDVVRRLIGDQFPQWSRLAVQALPTAATVNAIFRVGDSLAARFPLRVGEPETVRTWLQQEARASLEFARSHLSPRLSRWGSESRDMATRCPGAFRPGCRDGMLLPGTHQARAHSRRISPACSFPFGPRTRSGRRFTGAGRGGHLSDHDDWMNLCFTKSHGLVDVGRLRSMWEGAAMPARRRRQRHVPR